MRPPVSFLARALLGVLWLPVCLTGGVGCGRRGDPQAAGGGAGVPPEVLLPVSANGTRTAEAGAVAVPEGTPRLAGEAAEGRTAVPPAEWGARVARSRALLEEGKALAAYDALAGVPPDGARLAEAGVAPYDFFAALATAAELTGQVSVAIRALEGAYGSAVEPEMRAKVANNLAHLLSVSGSRPDEALRFAAVALAAEPESAAYLDTVAGVYLARGEPRKALAYYLEARRLASAPGEVAVIEEGIGDARWSLKERELAVIHWRRSLALEEKNGPLRRKIELAERDFAPGGGP